MSLGSVLIEGKKETLIDKYKSWLDVTEFVDILTKMIDSDPSPTKKYSEWMINELIRLVEARSYSTEMDEIADLVIRTTKKFHEVSPSISDKDMESFIEVIKSYRNRGIEYFTDLQQKVVIRSPKDINSYPSVWTLELLNKTIQDRKELEKLEIDAKKNVEKVYEDDRFLIVIPHSYVASCFYGANTKWCVSMKDTKSHYTSYSQNGRLIYVIDKKSTSNLFGKMAIHQDKSGNVTVWDQQDGMRSLHFLYDRFGEIQEQIQDTLNKRDDYNTLLKLKQGKIPIGGATLSSPYFVKYDGSNIVFNFNGDLENILHLFGLREDEIWDYTAVLSRNYDYTYYSEYQADEDLRDGYVFYSFNIEHLTLLKSILDIMNPPLSECITDENGVLGVGRDCVSDIGEFISDLNNNKLNEIKEVYAYARDMAMVEGVKKEIYSEFCNAFAPIGLHVVKQDECFYEYAINIDTLIGYYEENLGYFKNMSVDEVMEHVISSKIELPVGSPYEIAYESLDEEVFEDNFNNELTEVMVSFLEELEDGEEFTDFNEYMKTLTQLKKIYGFNKWVKLRGIDGDHRIKLDKLDPEDNRVEFTVRDFKNGRTKSGKAKVETINTLVSNASMFDPFFDDQN